MARRSPSGGSCARFLECRNKRCQSANPKPRLAPAFFGSGLRAGAAVVALLLVAAAGAAAAVFVVDDDDVVLDGCFDRNPEGGIVVSFIGRASSSLEDMAQPTSFFD